MQPSQIRALIQKVLAEVEEEDVGISLLSRQYQNQEELAFFSTADQEKICITLEKLAQDSERHKRMLLKLVDFLGEKLHGS